MNEKPGLIPMVVEKTGGARAGAVEATAVEKADDADAAAGAGGGEGAR